MKKYVKRLLFVVVFAVFSLTLLFHFAPPEIPKPAPPSKSSSGLPVRLRIPTINVDTQVQQVGVTESGEMDAPTNAVEVGWFKLGSRPGEIGSAVIAGHFDAKNGEAGVFANLHKLKEGDELRIVDDTGTTTIFIVREIQTFNPGYADDVFSRNDHAHLNLVTCDGVWDGTKKSYSKRLVVFADISP